MVGAFHMPKLVFTNINTLQTLPDNQFSAGMGEVIKHGLIKDAAYYEWLLENAADIWARKPEALRKTVTWSNEIKRAVVEKDPTRKRRPYAFKLWSYAGTRDREAEKL